MGDLTISALSRTVIGNKRMTIGTATVAGTGGEINTGLRICEWIGLTSNDAGAVSADGVTVNETLPCDGSAVTVICTNTVDSIEFMAIGY